MTRPVPDLLVEQLARGELTPAKAVEVRARLAAESGGLARLAALEQSNAEILIALPPERVAREVGARTSEVSSGSRARLGWVALMAVAAAVVIVIPSLSLQDPARTMQAERAKGDASLRLYRATPGGHERVSAGETVRAGDTVQIAYVAHGQPYGVILSVDGRGQVTLHFPEHATDPTTLGSDGEVALTRAYELDNAPDHETFVLLTAPAPLPVSRVLEAFRSRGLSTSLDFAPSVHATRLALRKVP